MFRNYDVIQWTSGQAMRVCQNDMPELSLIPIFTNVCRVLSEGQGYCKQDILCCI